MMGKIRVILAEDHNLVREGLRLLLSAQPDIEVVGEATNGREAVDCARQACPDVAVLDIAMPELDGLQAAVRIRANCPDTRILILSMYDNDAYFFQALEVGATGYMLKKATSEDLVNAVRTVARGEAFFPGPLARKLLDSHLQRTPHAAADAPPGLQDLSEREREIMFLIVSGLSNQEIADRLIISASTVQTHRTNILRKLNLESTVDMVRYAIRNGLIEP